MKKLLLIGLLTLCGGGFVVRAVLREDAWPFFQTATSTFGEKLKRLVDEYEFEYKKAEGKVAAAESQARELREKKRDAEAALSTARRRLDLAQAEIKRAEQAREGLADKRAAGQAVRLGSGRLVSPAELENMDRELQERLSLAGEKIGYLKQFVAMREQRVAQIAAAEQNSPMLLARLRQQLEHLQSKLDLYKDVRKWLAEEPRDAAAANGRFEDAQKALEDAHFKLDEKLGEADALLRSTTVQGNVDIVNDDRLVQEIRTILAD
jgi:chromosome segregation ATPase